MSASENYWEFNCTFSGKMQRVEDVVRTNEADFLYVYSSTLTLFLEFTHLTQFLIQSVLLGSSKIGVRHALYLLIITTTISF